MCSVRQLFIAILPSTHPLLHLHYVKKQIALKIVFFFKTLLVITLFFLIAREKNIFFNFFLFLFFGEVEES